MADDPRIEPAARAILGGPVELLGSGGDLFVTTCAALVAADAADPLRVLLADKDRALAFFDRVIHSKRDGYTLSWELLAALREVTNGG